jgi:membrane protein required for colicin V production
LIAMLEQVTLVDWLIAATVLVSTLISLARGFVKEALSLIILVAAMVISRLYGAQVATLLVDYISVPSLRLTAAYAGLFVGTMVVGGMVNYLLVQVIRMAGLGGTDRLLGMLFGFTRGVLITMVVIGILSKLPLSEDSWWQESIAIPHVLSAAEKLQIFAAEFFEENATTIVEETGLDIL